LENGVHTPSKRHQRRRFRAPVDAVSGDTSDIVGAFVADSRIALLSASSADHIINHPDNVRLTA
jgi:hypothetical protein